MSKSKYLERYPELVRFVQAHIAEYGFSPSALQISRRLGWPKSACQGYLRRLRAELELPPALPGYLCKYLSIRPLLLRQIKEYTLLHGFSPSLRSLASDAKISPTTLVSYLRRLRLEGLVDFSEGIPRSIRMKKKAVNGL